MNKRERCIYLRKAGNSYREIAKATSTPLSTVVSWTQYVKQTEVQKNMLKQKSREALQTGRITAQATKRAKYIEISNKHFLIGKNLLKKKLTQNEINCLTAGLYWAEGFKKDKRLGFANSDPVMINLILSWLISYLGIPKEHIRLRVGINISAVKRIALVESYWSKITNIPLWQFQKPYYQRSIQKKTYKNADEYYGVLRIRANGQNEKFRQILGMIEAIKDQTCQNSTLT